MPVSSARNAMLIFIDIGSSQHTNIVTKKFFKNFLSALQRHLSNKFKTQSNKSNISLESWRYESTFLLRDHILHRWWSSSDSNEIFDLFEAVALSFGILFAMNKTYR